jgi:hypothetical protein
MKRISLLAITILIAAPTVIKARSYVPIRYRTRWSPYAFGLVSGNVRYSPYAFNHKHNGLVYGDVRYSPYAFGHNRSGLVVDSYSDYFRSRYSPYYYPQTQSPVTVINRCCSYACISGSKHSDSTKQTNTVSYADKLIAREQKSKKLRDLREQKHSSKEMDVKETICRYLKNRNIDDYVMHGLLRIGGKTINVNFLLKDKNIMITYWNLDEVQSLASEPGYRRDYLVKHEQQWRNFYEKYTQGGGKVYQITTANMDEVLTKLTLCSELNEG